MKFFKLVSWLNHIELLLRLTWKNSNFRVFDDSFVDVDAKKLNVVLSSSGLANVDEDDDNHIKECDGADNNSIDDEEENSN
jgi:hypothetical protein